MKRSSNGMKKTIAVIFTIAVLGIIGVATKSGSANHQLTSPSNTSAASAMTPASTSTNSAGQTPQTVASYKDGTYTGTAEDTPYGLVQIAVVVSGGKIVDVNFLSMPSDQGHSRDVTAFAEPLLKQTTLSSQSANIDFVSGATTSSEAYQMSLQAALNQAQA